MSIPTNKEQLTKAIKEHYAELNEELLSIPIHLTSIKELDGHSKDTPMSVGNLVAYLIGWGQLVLKWNDKKSKEQEVDFPETNYKWNELGKLAQKFYKDYEKDSYKALLGKLDKTTNQILQLIDTKTDEELYDSCWYGKWTLGRMIQLNTSSPYKNAKSRIRRWKKARQIK